MILSKIKKHFSIALVRLNQKGELKKILNENHIILNIIVKSFLQLKSKKFLQEDSQVFESCEKYRSSILKNNSQVSYSIFGIDKKLSVRSICEKASSKPIWGQFLFFIIKKMQSPNVLEIGTNLGVSGSYILNALRYKKNSYFITMEGLSDLCAIASKQFERIDPTHQYEIREGLYEKTFPELINETRNFSICFIDGNHQKESTLEYFKKLKCRINKPAIMIFDDINWTKNMQTAWTIIKNDKDVFYTIDLFKWGIVIIDDLHSKKKKDYKLHLSY